MDSRLPSFPQHFQAPHLPGGMPFSQEYFNNQFRLRKKEKKAHRKKKSHQHQMSMLSPANWVAPPNMMFAYPNMQPMQSVGYYPDVTQSIMNYTPVTPPMSKKLKTENVSLTAKLLTSTTNEPLSESDTGRSKQRKAKRKCMSASSRYKGVSWHKRDRCYMARVWVDGSSKHVGSFQQEMRAALAVDHTLLAMGKDSTHLNFPLQLERDIAASILKHQTVSQDVIKSSVESISDNNSTVSEEDMARKGLDRNGFPNCIETVLSDLLADIRGRKKPVEVSAEKPTEKPVGQRWESLIEEANKQIDLPVNKTVEEGFQSASEQSDPAGDEIESQSDN